MTAADPPPPIDLRPLFAPRSVAVVGASPRSELARVVRDNLAIMGSATRCAFVNPKYDELWGSPVYPDLASLPEVPDVVVVALNPLRATGVVEEAARVGARAVLIPGGGVVEGGEAAARMQREVGEIAIRHGIALLGPNCMGMIDRTTNSAVYIGDVNPWQPRGGVAGIAQSGSVTDAFIHAAGARIGFSRIVGSGSEVVLDVCDYLAYCLDDPETHTVILFVEGFKRPERFLALADRALEMGKPILAVKVGRSAQAQAAAMAHSGSLAGEDRVTDAALAAAGVVRCHDLDELLEAAELFAGCRRLGRSVGRGRTGVVTVSTGEASLIADLAARTGVDLPPVPAATRDRILGDLPTMGYVGNPIDPWGAADESVCYPAVFGAFTDSGAYDVLAIVHDFPYRSLPSEVEVARSVTQPLLDATRDRPDLLPVYVSLTSGEATPEVQAMLDEAGGVPLLRGAVEAFSAIARRAWWERRHARRLVEGPARATWPALAADRTPRGHDPDRSGIEGPPTANATAAVSPTAAAAGTATTTTDPTAGRRILPELESLRLLAAAGLTVTEARPAPDPASAAAIAAALGVPVVVKLDAPRLAHKTDVDGVRLGISGPAETRAAATELLAIARERGIAVRGLLVEPMAPRGVELILGMHRDPHFGPAVVVGLGGILAEVLDDVAIRLAPVAHGEALAMLDQLRGAPFLRGVRGGPAIDREAVAAMIVALGRFAWERPDVLEVDLNPVIAGPDGAVAVDALVVLKGERDG